MSERCPDCGLVQKSPPPYSSGCYCDYHCAGGKLCDERAEYRSRIAQLEACAEALEQAANGEAVRCLVSEQPGVYECRLDSLCAGCRARSRIAQLEAVVEQAKRLRRAVGVHQHAYSCTPAFDDVMAALERVKG